MACEEVRNVRKQARGKSEVELACDEERLAKLRALEFVCVQCFWQCSR